MSALDINLIRSKFPALTSSSDAAFLDNPGGTQTPQAVVDAITNCLINTNANLGGAFRTSQAADEIVAEAHMAMADFVNANSEREIIFGQNMTTLTFHISRSIGQLFSEGDEIILTTMLVTMGWSSSSCRLINHHSSSICPSWTIC